MRWIVLPALLCLGACATGAGRPAGTGAELPVSEQPVAGELRARAKAHTDLGMTYAQRNQLGIAQEEGRLALVADASYAPAYNLLGTVHMLLGETQLAGANFEKSISLAPGDPETNNNYGWFLCQQPGRENDGIQRLLVAARNPLYSAPTRPYFNAGLCALKLKDDVSAETYFRQAVAVDASNAAALFQLATLTYRLGRLDDTRRLIGEIHRFVEPTAETIWLALRVERRLGDRNAEAAYVAQLRRRFPESVEYQAWQQGRFE